MSRHEPDSPDAGGGTEEQGMVLVHCLLLMFVVVALAGLVQQRSVSLSRDTHRDRGELQALHAAEGGLARSRHALRLDPSFGGAEIVVGGCRVVVVVQRLADDQWEITSRATSHPGGVRGTRVTSCLVAGFGARRWYGVRR